MTDSQFVLTIGIHTYNHRIIIDDRCILPDQINMAVLFMITCKTQLVQYSVQYRTLDKSLFTSYPKFTPMYNWSPFMFHLKPLFLSFLLSNKNFLVEGIIRTLVEYFQIHTRILILKAITEQDPVPALCTVISNCRFIYKESMP